MRSVRAVAAERWKWRQFINRRNKGGVVVVVDSLPGRTAIKPAGGKAEIKGHYSSVAVGMRCGMRARNVAKATAARRRLTNLWLECR